jgi:hypothetical protein
VSGPPVHPIVDAVIEQMGALVDGRLQASATSALHAQLLGLEHRALAEALHQTLLFASFLDGEGGRNVALQLLELVERHAARLPLDEQQSVQSAVVLGKERNLMPVGASPPPPGAVRGGLAARLSVPPKR